MKNVSIMNIENILLIVIQDDVSFFCYFQILSDVYLCVI